MVQHKASCGRGGHSVFLRPGESSVRGSCGSRIARKDELLASHCLEVRSSLVLHDWLRPRSQVNGYILPLPYISLFFIVAFTIYSLHLGHSRCSFVAILDLLTWEKNEKKSAIYAHSNPSVSSSTIGPKMTVRALEKLFMASSIVKYGGSPIRHPVVMPTLSWTLF